MLFIGGMALFEQITQLRTASARIARRGLALTVLMAVAACGDLGGVNGINDPYEDMNRRTHAFNRSVDENLLRPVSNSYGEGVPQPMRRGVGNFAGNLGLPSKVVNNLLQLDLEGAVRNTLRFGLNSTLGLAGLFDPATEFGLEEEDTDFGETLYKYGMGEGRFVELPLIGPSTERHAVGRVVDLFTNPISYMVDSPESYISSGANVLARVDDRYEYSSTIDAILYESEDSYAQARLLYLQNRRYELGVEVSEEEVDEIDALFEDLYGE